MMQEQPIINFLAAFYLKIFSIQKLIGFTFDKIFFLNVK